MSLENTLQKNTPQPHKSEHEHNGEQATHCRYSVKADAERHSYIRAKLCHPLISCLGRRPIVAEAPCAGRGGR
jgi:hypothetical protein